MFTVDSHCILFVKWLKRDRGRAVCSGVSKSEPQCGLKGAVTPELDHWHQLHNHARSSCSVNSTKYSSIHLHVTDMGNPWRFWIHMRTWGMDWFWGWLHLECESSSAAQWCVLSLPAAMLHLFWLNPLKMKGRTKNLAFPWLVINHQKPEQLH